MSDVPKDLIAAAVHMGKLRGIERVARWHENNALTMDNKVNDLSLTASQRARAQKKADIHRHWAAMVRGLKEQEEAGRRPEVLALVEKVRHSGVEPNATKSVRAR